MLFFFLFFLFWWMVPLAIETFKPEPFFPFLYLPPAIIYQVPFIARYFSPSSQLLSFFRPSSLGSDFGSSPNWYHCLQYSLCRFQFFLAGSLKFKLLSIDCAGWYFFALSTFRFSFFHPFYPGWKIAITSIKKITILLDCSAPLLILLFIECWLHAGI